MKTTLSSLIFFAAFIAAYYFLWLLFMPFRIMQLFIQAVSEGDDYEDALQV
jgi:hypothetical protein